MQQAHAAGWFAHVATKLMGWVLRLGYLPAYVTATAAAAAAGQDVDQLIASIVQGAAENPPVQPAPQGQRQPADQGGRSAAASQPPRQQGSKRREAAVAGVPHTSQAGGAGRGGGRLPGPGH